MGLKCYFAHPFLNKDSSEKDLIIKTLRERKVDVYDPFVFEEDLLKKYEVKTYYDDPNWELAREMTTKDLKAIHESDMLLAWLPASGIGTSMEIMYAYIKKKFIQIISPIIHPFYSLMASDRQFFLSPEDYTKRRYYKWKNKKVIQYDT